MNKKILTILSLAAISLFLSYGLGSCKKEQSTQGLEMLSLEIPDGFPQPSYNFQDNPLTREGFELGRKLFYDKRLSIDNLHPCSSCHEQKSGFGTFEHDLSHGVFGSHTLRNAPVLFNLAWSTSFHWDGEFTSLIDEAVHPITGNLEMGESFSGIIKKIQDDDEYKKMFKKVFNYPIIRPEYITKALVQFTGSIVSGNSKYDRYKKGQSTFTPQEENGYQLFKIKCAGCHKEPLFTDHSFRNIGLPVDNLLKDYGRIRVTGKKEDSLKFKVPTLRNTFVSSNYVHDGRFNTLYQVMEHYRSGVKENTTLDPLVKGGISLSNAEMDDLYDFLKTLTDSTMLLDTRLQRPQ